MNTRVLDADLTGIQRYTLELVSRFAGKVECISPASCFGGVKGHIWEQCILPVRLRGELLFSPANTGPLSISKQVVTIHDVVPIDRPEWFDLKKASLYRFLTPRLARSVAHVITISEFTKQRLLAHVPMDEKRVTVIPNGVDCKFRRHDGAELAQMRTTLGLGKRRYVLCVGTLEPRKNLPRLLKAWNRIVGTIADDIWLVLTGKQDNADLFAQVAGLDCLPPRVHLTGHVPDETLPSLYAGAMVFAFPSLYEGFGLPPLEAMASGVPVLTGNQTSLPEVVGNAGLMVDPYDVSAIAAGLLSLIEDGNYRTRLISHGLEHVSQFSWDVTADKTWSVLQKVYDSYAGGTK